MKTIQNILSGHENRDILVAFAHICAARAACNARVAERTACAEDYTAVNNLALRATRAAVCVQDATTDVLAIHYASEAARYAVETARAFYALHLGESGGDSVARGEHARQIEELCAFLRKETGSVPCP